MADLTKKDKEFVVPGDEIVKSMEFLPGRNTFREGDSIFSKRLGILHVENHVVSVVPLTGPYVPRGGDMVVGEVDDIQKNGWVIKIDDSHSTFLPMSGVREFIRNDADLSKFYDIGELMYLKVSAVNNQNLSLSMQDTRARKLFGGRIIHVDPVKVPRIIGKQGSMISLINKKTGCRITVGQNGIIWIDGEKSDLVIKAIKTVEKESHTEGLTDKIEKMLGKESKE